MVDELMIRKEGYVITQDPIFLNHFLGGDRSMVDREISLANSKSPK